MKLTKTEHAILERLASGEELTNAIPGGWWLEEEHIDARPCRQLIRKCLISVSYQNNREDYFVYNINEWGRAALLGTVETMPDYKKYIAALAESRLHLF